MHDGIEFGEDKDRDTNMVTDENMIGNCRIFRMLIICEIFIYILLIHKK